MPMRMMGWCITSSNKFYASFLSTLCLPNIHSLIDQQARLCGNNFIIILFFVCLFVVAAADAHFLVGSLFVEHSISFFFMQQQYPNKKFKCSLIAFLYRFFSFVYFLLLLLLYPSARMNGKHQQTHTRNKKFETLNKQHKNDSTTTTKLQQQ